MITALAPLGAKYRLQFVPEYMDDGNVSVAVIFSLMSVKAEDTVPKTLSFSGTVAEVEQAITAELPKAVEKLTAHATLIEELDAQLAKEKEEKSKGGMKGTVKSRVEEKKPGADKTKPTPAKPAAAAKDTKSEAPKAEPKLAAPIPAGLTPAWKKKAELPAAPSEPAAPAADQPAPSSATPVAEVAPPADATTIDAEPEELGDLFPS